MSASPARQASPPSGQRIGRGRRISGDVRLALAIAGVFLAVNLVGLDRSPLVWIDEAVMNDPARELAWHGAWRSSIFRGTPTPREVFFTGYASFEDAYFWQPPTHVLTTAAVYRLFGFGIVQTRALGLLAAVGSIICMYFLARELFGSRPAGAIAAVLLALDPPILLIQRSGRMDSQCLFFVLLGLLLLVAWARRSAPDRWLAAAGLAMGLANTTHAVAIEWVPVGVVLILLGAGRSAWRQVALFVVFAGLPGLVWVGWGLTKPDLFVGQFLHHAEQDLTWGLPTGPTAPVVRIWQELARMAAAYQRIPLLGLAYGVGFALAVASPALPRRVRGSLAAIVLIPFLFTALLMNKEVFLYFFHTTLGLILATAGVSAHYLPRLLATRLPWRALAMAAASCVVANAVAMGAGGRLVALAAQWSQRDYGPVETAVRRTVPAGSVVWGVPEAWYAVHLAGSELRILGHPDPRVVDFAIMRRDAPVPAGFQPVAEVGQPLPPLFGRIRTESSDYQLRVSRSTAR